MAVFSFYYFIALVTVLFGFFFYSSGKQAYLVYFYGCILGLEIPIPFGSLTINKGQDNETEIGLNRGINIGGYGATSGLSITAQKNGSITTEST